MLISIIHRVNRARGLNLDPLNSLGVDKDAGGEGEVLGWGCSMGLQVSGGGDKQGPPIPSLCLLGFLNHNGKPVDLGREDSEKARILCQGNIEQKRRETCVCWVAAVCQARYPGCEWEPVQWSSSVFHPDLTLT